jgi:predicted dehydrogenase
VEELSPRSWAVTTSISPSFSSARFVTLPRGVLLCYPDVELIDPPGHVRKESPDRLLIQMLHEDGCITGLEIAGNRPPGSLFTFHIVGTVGEITLTGDHPYGAQSSNLKLSSTVLEEKAVPVPAEALKGPPANVAELYRAFGRDIREGTRTVPDFDHAVELTRLVRGIIVADQSGVRQRDKVWMRY